MWEHSNERPRPQIHGHKQCRRFEGQNVGTGREPFLVSGGRCICLSRSHAGFVQHVQSCLNDLRDNGRNSACSLRNLRIRISSGQTAPLRSRLLGMLASRKRFWRRNSSTVSTSCEGSPCLKKHPTVIWSAI